MMLMKDSGPVFPLGRVTLSPGAKCSLSNRDLLDAILSHMRGQQIGFTPDGHQFHFPFALEGCRVLGIYRTSDDDKFLIVTEADRSRTTVMLPEEF